MKSRLTLWGCIAVIVFLSGGLITAADGLEPGPLPAAHKSGGRPLLDAVRERKTTREFDPKPLPAQVVSDLLWTAFGVNRPENDHRTAPSAMNSQEIDIYVAAANGLFIYQPKEHGLKQVSGQDIRIKTGSQFGAPLELIFVGDLSRLVKAKPEDRPHYADVDTGFISQNVYLYCASEGLATVVHELGDRKVLAQAMNLRADQRLVLAQAVGYPKLK